MEEADRAAKKDHTNPAKATLENAQAKITTVQTATAIDKKFGEQIFCSLFIAV